ncbi:MAG TPA: sigma-70 family RNA polymerase sigma factor [Candidatus Acidoferrum sp.]|nr:sigma-70 family RNA polymerase sigma factor [Candidatus Acidoferrum sp.]
MQATMIAESIRTAKPVVARRAADNRRFQIRNSQSATETTATSAPDSPWPMENEKLDDSEVIRRAQEGDANMFESLYKSHCRRVYALCLRMVRNTAEAEDLTQEAFLLLFRKLHTFRGESAFSSWLHRLVVNTVLMHLRKKSLPAISMEAAFGPDDDTARSRMDIAASDLLLEGSIDRINLGRCIAQLPEGSREIFVLHDIQGYQHNEIAEMLGRSEGVSKSQLHRARKRLRELLHEIQREKHRDERVAAQKALCQDAG